MNNTMSDRFDEFSKELVIDFISYGQDETNLYLDEIAMGKKEILGFIQSEINLAVLEERAKLAKEIKEYYQNFFEVYDGKLPFSVLGQKATETEAMFFYQEGILQTIKMIEKDYPISSLKEGK